MSWSAKKLICLAVLSGSLSAGQFPALAEGWEIKQIDKLAGESHEVFVTPKIFLSQTKSRGTFTVSKAPEWRAAMYNQKTKLTYAYPGSGVDPLWESVSALLSNKKGLRALKATGKTTTIAGQKCKQLIVEDGSSEFWIAADIDPPWKKSFNNSPGLLIRCATVDSEGEKLLMIDTVSIKANSQPVKIPEAKGFKPCKTPGELYLQPGEAAMIDDTLGEYLDDKTAKTIRGLLGPRQGSASAAKAGTKSPPLQKKSGK